MPSCLRWLPILGLFISISACSSDDEALTAPIRPQFIPLSCPEEDPDCEESAPSPEQIQDMHNAIVAKTDCPEIRDLLLNNMSSILLMGADDSPAGWTEGTADDFTIWIHEDHWFHPQYLLELPRTLYEEGAHALVGSNHQHDEVWVSAFSCYDS